MARVTGEKKAVSKSVTAEGSAILNMTAMIMNFVILIVTGMITVNRVTTLPVTIHAILTWSILLQQEHTAALKVVLTSIKLRVLIMMDVLTMAVVTSPFAIIKVDRTVTVTIAGHITMRITVGSGTLVSNQMENRIAVTPVSHQSLQRPRRLPPNQRPRPSLNPHLFLAQ